MSGAPQPDARDAGRDARDDAPPRDLALVKPARDGIKPAHDTRADQGAPPPPLDGSAGKPPLDASAGTPPDAGGKPPLDSASPPPGDSSVDQGTTSPTRTAHYFPKTSIWYQNIASAPLDPQSSQVIAALAAAGGWGTGSMRIDFSNHILVASAGVPMRSFVPTGDHFLPDCDIAAVPVPPGGALEEESGYRCTKDGDCHLLVVHLPTKRLFEMWRANFTNASGQGGTFYGGCLAVWDLTKVYGPDGRGDQCTSADAAGYPIAPLLFTADEVQAGAIEHALRFILPNGRIRGGVYLHPATHSTGSASGGANLPPYGTRLRLRQGFKLASLKPGARIVARALKRYGMFLADGGTIALTAESDRYSSASWSGLLAAGDLSSLKVTDFEMVAGGTRINYTGNCKRNGPTP